MTAQKFSELRFYVSMLILIAAVISSFAITSYKTDQLIKRVTSLEKNETAIHRIEFNLQSLFIRLDEPYIVNLSKD